MTKRILFAEITQGIEALSSARKGEITLRAEKVKLNPATKLSAKKRHSIEEPQLQGKLAELSKGYKAMSQDTDREQEAFAWSEAVVGDAKGWAASPVMALTNQSANQSAFKDTSYPNTERCA